MLSLFYKNKKVLGLDINEEYIRYVKVSRNEEENTILSFGEEKIAQKEPRNSLISTLSDIVRKTKIKDAVVSLPFESVVFHKINISKNAEGDTLSQITFSLTEKNLFSLGQGVLFYEKIDSVNGRDSFRVAVSSSENVAFLKSVFENSGVNVLRIVSKAEALVNSCVKKGNILPSIVLNMSPEETILSLHNPFEEVQGISFPTNKEKIPFYLEDTYLDFYKKHKEKVGYLFATGALAQDESFLNYLSRVTRLNVEPADIFINIKISSEVPIITKDESFLYAVALGLAIS